MGYTFNGIYYSTGEILDALVKLGYEVVEIPQYDDRTDEFLYNEKFVKKDGETMRIYKAYTESINNIGTDILEYRKLLMSLPGTEVYEKKKNNITNND